MIKAYGYNKLNEDAELPLTLREVTLNVTTTKDLDKIIEFFLYVKDKFEECEITEVGRHEHFQDWMSQRVRNWTSSETDIIVGTQKEN